MSSAGEKSQLWKHVGLFISLASLREMMSSESLVTTAGWETLTSFFNREDSETWYLTRHLKSASHWANFYFHELPYE